MAGDAMELYELTYSDLLLFTANEVVESADESQRMESVGRMVVETLGPNGPGLLAVTEVPGAATFRRNLLPLSRKLALLNNEDRKKLLKEHELGSDVPLKNLERVVSSFAKNLKYDKRFESNSSCERNQLGVVRGDESFEADCVLFKNLGDLFNGLGYCMMEVGLHLAQICDKFIGGHELQQSLLESGTAKGRLIHYHSTIDNEIIKEAANRRVKKGSKTKNQIKRNKKMDSKRFGSESCDEKLSDSTMWQQWHYDYGIFTMLTVPMFLLSSNCKGITEESEDSCVPCDQETPSPSGHTYLQIFHANKDQTFMVKAPPESLIVQVGEAADLLSMGKLRATLHRVCRPPKPNNLSRETFVVFLQPAWNKTFSLSQYPLEHLHLNDQRSRLCTKDLPKGEKESDKLSQMIRSIVPSLSSRLRDGMTFADFSRATTNQYYGSKGLQSNGPLNGIAS
ncbi:unnamed protein product [Cuscuta campestris]|uniref:feruloyl-CoA 6-hydroxylase n=1 Tax=Cuscuta campestris TaxID=132261 RepID=A0A484M597_9ASTE|nr:unnamed protein product [Cuscuta campestris]